MKAEIIGIGTEILLGHTLNTNAAYISRKLAGAGIDVYYHTTVGDNKNRLYESIKTALARSDIAITTGGLGPTIDDITLGVIAKTAKSPLALKKKILRQIKRHFQKRGIKMPANNIRQAYVPKGAIWLANHIGTAPGLIVKTNKKFIIALPGPPREMQPIFENEVLPFLENHIFRKAVILSRTLKTTGLAESQVHDKIAGFLRLSGKTTVGIYAHPGQVDIKITTKAASLTQANRNITKIEKKIRLKLGKLVFGTDAQTLEGAVARLLKTKTISIAESCTGGLISSRLTDVSGISKNLFASVIAYSNKSKVKILRISPETLRHYGAASKEVAANMAVNARLLLKSDIGISTTGIAGPSGATGKKPVGLVYIGLSDKNKVIVKKFNFTGTRDIIKFRASQAALDTLRLHLLK
jgi:nicotinamide-nucleotide amidase